MNTWTIIDLLDKSEQSIGDEVTVNGWVRSFRSNRFISLNDGSTLRNLQVVIDFASLDESVLKQIGTASALQIRGRVVESQGGGQSIEVLASHIHVHGYADPNEVQQTILQPKVHSFEKLREQAHLRFRTNIFGAVMRIRHHLAFAVHEFFHNRGFFYVHTPIITGSDAEGAGETFTVTGFDILNTPKTEDGCVNFSEDFFGIHTKLTVSGQLEGETAAMGLGKIYTFGPTFRAENSNTSRHLSEFWMIEPEMAFYDLKDNMQLAEDFVKHTLKHILMHANEDLTFLDERFQKEQRQKPADERSNMSLIEKLNFVTQNTFERLSYTDAIEILKNSNQNKKGKFVHAVTSWGIDLQSEHERYLVEKHFKAPVILFDYPVDIKAFYMRQNDDGKTVAAMDVLFPGIGEVIGGSQREERLEKLEKRMKQAKIDPKSLWWYLDTRKLGTVPHSGFGLGFERLVLFATGMSNIRDVIPYPRTPKNAAF